MLLLVILCGLLVTTETSLHPPQDGDVRLSDKEFRYSKYYNRQYQLGRVEIYFNSTWGTICWDGWTSYETQPVCNEAGFGYASDGRRAPQDKIVTGLPILLEFVYCYREERLSECRHGDYYQVSPACSHADDVWVECSRPMPRRVNELQLQLVEWGSTGENEFKNEHGILHAGLVQAKLNGAWHYISGEGWDEKEASIVCHQLGYPAMNSVPGYNASLISLSGQSTVAIMRQLDCLGIERELKECYHKSWRQEATDANELASLDCKTRSQYLATKSSNEFRLRGGSNYWEGRLEVLHQQRWGTVCGKRFLLAHADIACKSLGLGRAQKVLQTASTGYGRGIGQIWLGDFDCVNSLEETGSLLECEHSRWSYSSCGYGHVWDVGISCTAPRPEREIRVWKEYTGTREPGVKWYYTELLHEGRWSVPCCSTLYTQINMDMLCRDLGLGFGRAFDKKCAPDISRVRRSGLYGIIYCAKGEFFSEQCLRYFYSAEECAAGYDLIGCADRVPDLVPSLLFFERTLRYYNSTRNAVVLDGRERNQVDRKLVGELTCAIDDNCLTSSVDKNNPLQERKLLRFDSHTDNFGLLPFFPPVPKHEWIWHNCHQHFHSMEVFVSYHLLGVNGTRVAEGHKASFCLEDSYCATSVERQFACDELQGISVNCGDSYGAELDCQWIDVTDVPPGTYTVEMTINPLNAVLESDYENNILTCMIDYDEEGFYSTYNCLHSDHTLEREEEH